LRTSALAKTPAAKRALVMILHSPGGGQGGLRPGSELTRLLLMMLLHNPRGGRRRLRPGSGLIGKGQGSFLGRKSEVHPRGSPFRLLIPKKKNQPQLNQERGPTRFSTDGAPPVPVRPHTRSHTRLSVGIAARILSRAHKAMNAGHANDVNVCLCAILPRDIHARPASRTA